MVSALGNMIIRYPNSFGIWACLMQEIITGTNEIAVVGNNVTSIQTELLRQYIPQRVLMVSEMPEPGYPLLAGKPVTRDPYFYLCRTNTCHHPVFSVKELITLIDNAPGG